MRRSRCASCRYAWEADVGLEGEMLRACLYILRAGRRRPCPPGRGCTVYERRRPPEEARHEDH